MPHESTDAESLLDALTALAHRTRSAARNGKYQLVLGAGASYGARNHRGQAVPMADDLVRRLAGRYQGAHITESTQLGRAYQRSVSVSSAEDTWHFLKDVFSGCHHERWFLEMMNLPWKRAWTLNVDDTFERAYARSLRRHHSPLRVVNWTDDYSDSGRFELVHLHGSISTPEPSPLIFSASEYVNASSANRVWHQVFRGVVQNEPVIVLGAKILDDPDVESIFLSHRVPRDTPSFFVDPFISEDYAWELERSGYQVIKATAEQFVDAWKAVHSLSERALEKLYTNAANLIPQLKVLSDSDDSASAPSHDVLGGSEPSWNDARKNLLAEFGWMREAYTRVIDWVDEDDFKAGVLLLTAPRLAGATAGAYRLARRLHDRDFHVLWFDKSTRFDVDDVVEYCSGRGPVIVFVDGAHRFANDVDRALAVAGGRNDVKLIFVMLERRQHQTLTEDALQGIYEKSFLAVPLRRSKNDAKSVVEILSREGRLGIVERITAHERWQHFEGRDIFSSMGDLSRAPGFQRRFKHEIVSLDNQWQRDLLLLVTLASGAGAQVSLVEASFATGVPVPEIARSCAFDSHLSALVEVVDDLVYPRQRDRSTEVIRGNDGASYLSRLSAMLISLAPLYTRASHSRRNRVSILVASLMGARGLREAFRVSSLNSFYEALLPAFGDWNARYWEQRAIDARLSKNLATAESFALRAVSINDDAFTQTTLGTVLMERACEFAHEENPEWVDYYQRGYDALETAAGSGPGRVARTSFLRSGLTLLETLGRVQDRSLLSNGALARVEADWSAVYSILRVKFLAEFDEDRELLQLSGRFSRLTDGSQETDRPRQEVKNLTVPRLEQGTADALRKVLREQTRPVRLSIVGRLLAEELGLQPGDPRIIQPLNSLTDAIRSVRPRGEVRQEGKARVYHPSGIRAARSKR